VNVAAQGRDILHGAAIQGKGEEGRKWWAKLKDFSHFEKSFFS